MVDTKPVSLQQRSGKVEEASGLPWRPGEDSNPRPDA